MKTRLLATAAMVAVLTGGLAMPIGSASAAFLTVSPSGAGLSNAPDFSFNGIRTSDFASINLTSTGGGNFSFTQIGFLPVASFDPGNFTPPGLNGSAGATRYGLYIAFTASGKMSTLTSKFVQGSFDTLSYTLMGDPGYNSSFNHFNPVTHQVHCVGCVGDITLASGTLFPGGTNVVQITNQNTAKPLPAAFVESLFNGTNGSFFVSPTVPFAFIFDTQFSNTASVTARYVTSPSTSTVTIGTAGNVGGSGTGQFLAVPEPASLTLLGAGLVGLGLVSRRKRS